MGTNHTGSINQLGGGGGGAAGFGAGAAGFSQVGGSSSSSCGAWNTLYSGAYGAVQQGLSWADVYLSFFEFLTGIKDLRIMPWGEILANCNLPFSQLYEDGARCVCLLRTLQRMMTHAGIMDFGFEDLLKVGCCCSLRVGGRGFGFGGGDSIESCRACWGI